jgi:rhomboid family GlyGly-CTERM serine protease
LVHLGWGHLWLNLAALLLVRILLEDRLSQAEWASTALAAAFAIDLGLYIWDERVIWYVGLSGVLHGLVAYGTLKLLRERSAVGALLAVGLLVKLTWEQTSGPIPFSESSSGGPVVVAAHLYGTAGGILAFAAHAFAHRRRPRNPAL